MFFDRNKCYSCDFETTTYDGQDTTEVWAGAIVKLYSEQVKIYGSIKDFFDYVFTLPTNSILYFHNLKFDGSFILDYFLNVLKLKPNVFVNKNNDYEYNEDLFNNTFRAIISDLGQWYCIDVRYNYKTYSIRDSLKLAPFSLRDIGKSFNTKHQKTEIEYKGYRYANCPRTKKEDEYISNDVLVLKEFLEIMIEEKHTKLTIGACCLAEFKSTHFGEYKELFPDLSGENCELPCFNLYGGISDCDLWVRKSYKGGWCHLKEGKENQLINGGCTLDVNSLYPSMMSSESGNYFPVGKPQYIYINKIGESDLLKQVKKYVYKSDNQIYYFVHIKTAFDLKENKLPFIQIKGNPLYRSNECLKTSKLYNRKTGNYDKYYVDDKGVLRNTLVDLYLTMTDFKLILEHYNLTETTIIDILVFHAEIGLFDKYIEKYRQQKLKSKGALRTLAKLFLNNLYGKFSSSRVSSFKIPYVKDNGVVGFTSQYEEKRKIGYVPIGSAITSYSRNFTIRAAQANYNHFIYADTDSIHCDCTQNKIVGVRIHDKNFCCWKCESEWDEAIFVRQKTYIEHIIKENGDEINPFYNIKCAGMTRRCKELLHIKLSGGINDEAEFKDNEGNYKYNEVERNFIQSPMKLEEFKIGLQVPSKLTPKRIKGGIILTDTTYEMR